MIRWRRTLHSASAVPVPEYMSLTQSPQTVSDGALPVRDVIFNHPCKNKRNMSFVTFTDSNIALTILLTQLHHLYTAECTFLHIVRTHVNYCQSLKRIVYWMQIQLQISGLREMQRLQADFYFYYDFLLTKAAKTKFLLIESDDSYAWSPHTATPQSHDMQLWPRYHHHRYITNTSSCDTSSCDPCREARGEQPETTLCWLPFSLSNMLLQCNSVWNMWK